MLHVFQIPFQTIQAIKAVDIVVLKCLLASENDQYVCHLHLMKWEKPIKRIFLASILLKELRYLVCKHVKTSVERFNLNTTL